MVTKAAWSSPAMWRVAGALKALRGEIENSKAVVEASRLARLNRECSRLEQTRKGLVIEARRLADGMQAERDVLTQRIIQFYRDVGELERVAESKCGVAERTDYPGGLPLARQVTAPR